MNSQRKLLILAAALAGLAFQPAMAFTLTTSAGLTTSTPGAVTFATFDGSTPVDPTYATISGGVINGGADPGAGGNWIGASATTGPGVVTINFGALQNYLGFYWGSNDGSTNSIELYNGTNLLGTLGGNGSLNAYWNITAGVNQAFNSVQLKVPGCCFEVDNLAVMAVPEPAPWALMGLGALPLIGSMRRRVIGG